jgi:hypothetical protein
MAYGPLPVWCADDLEEERMNEVTAVLGMSQIECCVCGIVFWVPTGWVTARRDDHEGFSCPNKHALSFHGKSETEKLREALEREKRCCEVNRASVANLTEQIEHRENQIRGYKGALAKEKKRRPRQLTATAGPDAG